MSMLRVLALFGALGAMALWSAACTETDEPDPVLGTSGVALSVDFVGDTDVAAMRFAVERVACAPGEEFEALEATKDMPLEDMPLPGSPAYEDNPFDAAAEHLFADAFFWLPAGCYDVTVTPLNAAGQASADCTGAAADGIEVLDGEVTEITLVMQCEGPGAGGLDVVGVLNHPPLVDLIVYTPSKFVFTCEMATICAYASDPDGDPLEFEWSTLHTDFTATDAAGSSCIELAVDEAGTEMITVTVYDLYIDDEGNLQRIEDLVAPEQSRDSAVVPLHVSEWNDAFAGQPGVRTVELAPGCGLN